jgi:molybdopterin-guanine dinucleotide biosynthesis protein A
VQQLGCKPLIDHAVGKLRGLCAEVHILSGNPALAAYAPLVGDIHPGCGPIGGMEAALHHSSHAWNLFLAVDMPFLPTAFIRNWMGRWTREPDGARIRMFTAEVRPQPGFCLLHKEVLPFLSESILRGEYKLMRAFNGASEALGRERGVTAGSMLWSHAVEAGDDWESELPTATDHGKITASQLAMRSLWFANLNTPEDFVGAQEHLDGLDDSADPLPSESLSG